MTKEELEKELKTIQKRIDRLESSFDSTVKMIHSFFSQHAGLIQNNTDNIEKMADSLNILYKQIMKAINK